MLFDFRCNECEKTEEHWTKSDVREMRCSCGGTQVRLIGGKMAILDPLSGDYPGATMKWARHHEKAAKQGG